MARSLRQRFQEQFRLLQWQERLVAQARICHDLQAGDRLELHVRYCEDGGSDIRTVIRRGRAGNTDGGAIRSQGPLACRPPIRYNSTCRGPSGEKWNRDSRR